jgi:hypothetical protein
MNTRKEYTYITSGIRKMKKPESVHVFLPNGERPLLSVIDNENSAMLPISRRVAEVLIAEGYPYGD